MTVEGCSDFPLYSYSKKILEQIFKQRNLFRMEEVEL